MVEETAVLAPERARCLSGSALKLIAITTMIADHVTKRILVAYAAYTTPIALLGGASLAHIGESVGRLAFPLYCFLLVEGFCHTHDRRRYGINLLVFALLSEVPFDLSRTLMPYDPSYQNVFVTLFVSYLGLCAYEGLRDRATERAVAVIGLALLSMALQCDYGPRGFAMVLMLYVLRSDALAKTALGCCITLATWRAGLAFIPINLYNGKRGFVRGPILKYAFYAAYPVHLLVLWHARVRLGI